MTLVPPENWFMVPHRTLVRSLGYTIRELLLPYQPDLYRNYCRIPACMVYRVEKDGAERTIKLPRPSYMNCVSDYDQTEICTHEDTVDQIRRENEILDKIGRVPGIVKKHAYHSDLSEDCIDYLFNMLTLSAFSRKIIPAIVKEYVPGQPFGEKPLSTHATRTLTEAVDTLHGAGYARLDIDPSNIIVTPDGNPVIIDLGFAVRADEVEPRAWQQHKADDIYYLKHLCP